jgi:drug/metabolite transporter (DMT)-like permease
MKGTKTFPLLLAFGATYLIWGTTYLAIRIGLETVPPFIMGTLRYLVAGVILLAVAKFRGEAIFNTGVKHNLAVGAVLLTCGQAILFWAELYISSGYAAVLISTLPLWFVLLDKKQWRIYWSQKTVIWGLVLGFIGILLLFGKYLGMAQPGTDVKMELLASLAILVSCISWAGASLYHKAHPVNGSMYLQLGWQLMGGLLTCFIVSLFTGDWKRFSVNAVSTPSLLAVLYLAIAGSVVTFFAYTWLLTKKPPAVVGTYAYVNPVIAVILGAVVANEIIVWEQVVGMVVILVSAFLVNSSQYQKKMKD